MIYFNLPLFLVAKLLKFVNLETEESREVEKDT